ncbi:acid sugar phosphatase [Luteimicrobium album]|uniref:Acid sugar phosphatase n=1 Tax=Luteimicrobium album TaxID=1054550 RepID=A0ABQ6I027_9MICO|nr:HAD-IIA family hydrolase [Luteimicrobium album]GMA23596.1 acid sugar phosphatase [Luteimicrobium album]
MSDTLRRPEGLFDAYFFDLDGTIYLGGELLPGAARTVRELRRRGIPVRFLSNNPTKDPARYAHKLESLGLPTSPGDVVNTVVSMVRWLEREHPAATIFAIAEAPLQQALARAGFVLSEDPAEIDVVVASYDRGFVYRKLQIAFDALRSGRDVVLVTTNPDPYCPLPGGAAEPDAAAVVAAIEACTGVMCTKNVGKPDPDILTAARAGIEASIERCVMVGDRIGTDIAMALAAGMTPGLVLTGEATEDDARGLFAGGFPGYAMRRVDHLIPAAVWDELGWTEGEN